MRELQKLSECFHIRRLSECDAQAIFNLYRSNPQYFEAMHDTPTLSSAKADLAALPPNKTYDDKYYLGFYDHNALIAVMDLILRFPNEQTVFVGLFMVDQAHQRKGIGSLIVSQALDYLKKQSFSACRLGYVQTNPQSRSFWTKNGFQPTGVLSKHENYTVVFMEKRL